MKAAIIKDHNPHQGRSGNVMIENLSSNVHRLDNPT